MNLKFWKRNRELGNEVRFLRAQLAAAEKRVEQAGERKMEMLQESDELQARLAAVYQRMPAVLTEAEKKQVDLERLMVLAGLGHTDRTWLTVLSYADEHARNEAAAAVVPGLGDAERQYNAGRAASAADWASALRDLRVLAEKKARKE